MRSAKAVMVFGVFDRLHPGHRYFLREARKCGRKLVVVVARDKVVRKLKNKLPSQNERQRLRIIRELPYVSQAVLGDAAEGKYEVVKRYRPDLICLGYDQKALGRDLVSRIRRGSLPKIKLVYTRAYYPNRYHSPKAGL